MIGQFGQPECVYASAITRGSQAGVWAEAVAKALSDSSFYAPFPETRLPDRFSPLVPRPEVHLSRRNDGGEGFGQNPALGVTWMRSGFDCDKTGCTLSYLLIYMPLVDDAGVKIYPVLKSVLMKHLSKPAWNLRFGKNSAYWRKGTSRYTVDMKIDGLPASADGTPRPGPPGNGPWITVSAGREEGDSEEP